MPGHCELQTFYYRYQFQNMLPQVQPRHIEEESRTCQRKRYYIAQRLHSGYYINIIHNVSGTSWQVQLLAVMLRGLNSIVLTGPGGTEVQFQEII